MDKRRYIHVLLRVLMVCCIAAIGYLAHGMLLSRQEYAAGAGVYAQIRAMREIALPAPGRPAQGNPSAEEEAALEAPALIDFDALSEINPDVTAWLSADKSVIDYPVVQGEDNAYYLNHLFTGERNRMGALFMDYRAPADFSGKCTAVYGHHMKDGSMFTSLTRYRRQDYYDTHPLMRLSVPGQEYELHLFAGIIGDGSYEFVRFTFDGEADFLAYIDELKAASTFKSEVAVDGSDKIVALATCTYEFDNARYVLFGKLQPV